MQADDAPRVDSHAHVYDATMPLSSTAWKHPAGEAPVEEYLAVLDTHGVQFAVLAAASIFGHYNDYTVAALRAHQRLRATVIADPVATLADLRQLDAIGVVGIRLQWRNVADRPDLTSPPYQKLLRRVRDLGWHVHIHDDGPRLVEPLRILEDSGVRIVIDHFGRPDPAHGLDCTGFQAVLRSVERGRTWVKLSAGFRLESPEAATSYAQELLAHAGPERLFWGSDWPFVGFESQVRYQETIDALTAWVPHAGARRQIGGETAMKFYFSRG
ncbi:MAG: amidohydrolase family protein [Polaromonas sp.]|nr:amidohydrolase family protein [Polaromonas sp.]